MTPAIGPDPDWFVDWFRWLVLVAIGVLTPALGYLHVRVNRVEDAINRAKDDIDEQREKTDSAIAQGDGKLWDVMDVLRRETARHQLEIAQQMGQLVTRADHHRDMVELADRVDRAIDRLGARLEGQRGVA